MVEHKEFPLMSCISIYLWLMSEYYEIRRLDKATIFKEDIFVRNYSWVFGGFPMLCIKYIAFTCFPPLSDTSQDRGLVDMFESRELRVLFSQLLVYCHVIFVIGFVNRRSRSCS